MEAQTVVLTQLSSRSGLTNFVELCEEISELVETQDEEGLQTLINAFAASIEEANLSLNQFDTVIDCLNEVFNGVIAEPDIA